MEVVSKRLLEINGVEAAYGSNGAIKRQVAKDMGIAVFPLDSQTRHHLEEAENTAIKDMGIEDASVVWGVPYFTEKVALAKMAALGLAGIRVPIIATDSVWKLRHPNGTEAYLNKPDNVQAKHAIVIEWQRAAALGSEVLNVTSTVVGIPAALESSPIRLITSTRSMGQLRPELNYNNLYSIVSQGASYSGGLTTLEARGKIINTPLVVTTEVRVVEFDSKGLLVESLEKGEILFGYEKNMDYAELPDNNVAIMAATFGMLPSV